MASIYNSILLGRTFKALDFYDGTEDVNKYDVIIFLSKNRLELSHNDRVLFKFKVNFLFINYEVGNINKEIRLIRKSM